MSELFWCLLIGFVYGVAVTLVVIATGRSIKVGRGPKPAAPEPPAAVEPPADVDSPVDVGLCVLDEQPVDVLSVVEVNARFDRIVRRSTWETWL